MKNFSLISTLSLSLILLSNSKSISQCSFNISNPTPCPGESDTLSVNSPMPDSIYTWDFTSDGTIDATGTSVTASYPYNTSPISYEVTLYINGSSCSTQQVMVKASPDPSISLVSAQSSPGTTMSADTIKTCSGTPNSTLAIRNTSSTYASNSSYEINWGDGTIENYDNTTFSDTTVLVHNYNSYGFKYLSVTAVRNNGCSMVKTYVYYNGSNPSVGLANPGGTTGLCTPTSITFPINNTADNPPGTSYTITVNGTVVQTYNQSNIPNSFTYNFTETSCGQVTTSGSFENAFDLRILASNPCGSSAATIEPIELSTPPVADFIIDEPAQKCPGEIWIFTNSSTNINEVISGNPTVCNDSIPPSWQIAPGSNGTQWNILGGNIFNSEELEVEFLVPGVYTITMTITSVICSPSTISKSITVLDPPTADADALFNSSTGCVPTIVNFNNLSTGYQVSYSWTITPTSGWNFTNSTNASSENPEINFTEPGIYNVKLTSSNLCDFDTWDTTLTFIAEPVITWSDIPDFCLSATLNFSSSNITFSSIGTPITSYQWSFPGGEPSSSTSQYPANVVFNTPGTYTVSASATNICGTTTVSQTFVVQTPSSISLPSNFQICIDELPVTLNASPSGGTWSGPGITPQGVFNPANAGPGINVLTYSFGNGVCSSDSSLTATVFQLPVVNAGNNQSACVNVNSVVLNGTPTGGTWTSSGSGVLNGNAFNPNASGPGTYTLTYTFTNAQGCDNSDDLIFTVFPLPVISVNDTTYCNTPGLVQLPFTNPAGGTWSGVGITGTQFDPIAAGGVGNYSATYSFTDLNSCTDSIIVDINVIDPANVSAGPDSSFCQDVTSYSLAPFVSPAGGTWSATGNGLSGSVFDPSQAGPGTHTLTYSVGTGNCLVNDQIVITVYALPTIDAGVDLSACESETSIPLNGSPLGGTWTSSGSGVLNGNAFNPNASGPGMFALSYTFIDTLGCENYDEIEFTVFPLPNVVSNDTTYCNTPGIVQLPYSAPIGGIWTGPGTNGDFFDPAGAGGVGDYQLTYIYTDANGCIDSAEVLVTVIEPVIVEAGSNDTLCANQGVYQLSGFSPPGGTWSGEGIIDASQGQFDPMIPGSELVPLTYSVGAGNCLVSDSIEILLIDINVDAGPDMELCLDAPSILLTGYSPAGGYWIGAGIVDSIFGTFDPGLAGVGVHQITYYFQDTLKGCVFSASKDITVHSLPQSYFEIPDEACINDIIQFANFSQSTYQVNWDFGDGSTSDLVNPAHIYTQPGWYTITLTTTTEFACTDSYSKEIFVTEPPVASFEPDINEGCAPLAVNFTNNSYGYQVNYFWDFGNGQTDTVSQPGTIFFDQGTTDTTYFVILSVSNQCAIVTEIDTITVFPLPQINFGTSIDTNCSPMVVQFANLTLGNPEAFYWDFGNGNTSTDSIPAPQTYYTDTVFVTYPITLVATNFCGTDTATQEIVVTPANVDAFFNIPSNIGCQPFTIQFTNFSTPDASVFWDFGDGNTSAVPNPEHTFEEPGDFIIIQYASTGCGYDSTTAAITVLPAPILDFEHVAAVCRGDSIQFLNTSPSSLSGTIWYFGDGDSSLLNQPFHIYQESGNFTITLQGISTLNGCIAEKNSDVLVWELPTTDFQPSVLDGCVPLTISFDNLSNGASYFIWNFGDGNTTVGTEPAHTFLDDGSYPVTLVGTDINGCSDTSILNFIQAYPIPEADFSMERDRLCGLPVQLSLTNNSQGAQGYIWSFGDGSTSTLVSPVHQYMVQGYYQVGLIAENAFSCRDTTLKSFNSYPIPLAEFDVLPDLGCEPLPVEFINYSTGSNRYYWSFGDEQSSTEPEPGHIYLNDGFYSVQLISSFDDVCFDTLAMEDFVTVLPSPFANFAFEDINQDVPTGVIQFNNLSEDAVTYLWDFGDGGESNEENPIHRYYENCVWQVFLEATGSTGCKDDTLLQVTPEFFRGLFIPNAFSPEQGIGDVRLFKPKGVGLIEYNIEVFSPYGQLVWKSGKLLEGQPTEAWDGTLNGHLLPQDVYVWKAFAIFEDGTVWQGMLDKNGKLKTMGSLVLLR